MDVGRVVYNQVDRDIVHVLGCTFIILRIKDPKHESLKSVNNDRYSPDGVFVKSISTLIQEDIQQT